MSCFILDLLPDVTVLSVKSQELKPTRDGISNQVDPVRSSGFPYDRFYGRQGPTNLSTIAEKQSCRKFLRLQFLPADSADSPTVRHACNPGAPNLFSSTCHAKPTGGIIGGRPPSRVAAIMQAFQIP